MKFSLPYFLVLITAFLMAGCASSYKPINPPYIGYSHQEKISDSIKIGYEYQVLQKSRNWKYARKEENGNIRLVAFRVENDSKQVFRFGKNMTIYARDTLLVPLEGAEVFGTLRQSPPAYALYLLLTPIHLISVNFNGSPDIFPYGFIIGPGLAAWNIIVAARANHRFKNELMKYDLLNRDILPGEIVYGLVGLSVGQEPDLHIKIAHNTK